MLKDAGLAPDLLSYAAALQCMGRLDRDASAIQRCLKQMAHDGLQPQALFTSLSLCKEDQAALLRALRKAEPTFSAPQPPLPVSQLNSSPLLREIYDKDRPVSYPKQHLPLKTLKGLFQQQLSVEMATTITVDSVEKAPSLTTEVLQAVGTRPRRKPHLAELGIPWSGSVAGWAAALSPHLTTLQALPPQGESLLFLAQQLGLRVFNRHVVQRKRLTQEVRELERRYFKYLHLLASDTQVAASCLPRQHWEALGAPEAPHEQPWPLPVVAQLGKQLAEVLVQTVRMPGHLAERQGSCKLIPVLYHVYSFRSFRQIGILKPHPAFIQLLATAAERTMTFEAAEMHSLRTDALYRLSLAQHLRHRVFWLPHNMDFRGRTYPCPPHFNHLGSDLARALLEFAEGRPLGPHGLDWLKIHLVNLTGLKKRESLQARLAFAEEVMPDILDSADRPMTGRKWWMEADEPWQALACCMEIARAVRAPDPAAHISHFPVHQDGSCNGLQHYAALGRDSVGAASVNLVPSDLPQDVYSGVATQVEVFRRQDAEQGMRVAQVLEGFISRKVVKQTVMTVVYGVTRYGGRLQIEKRLRELSDFPQEFVWEASHYLVRQVFNSLQEMFSGTRAIQRWLAESARLIARTGSAVEWVTPLGIPVIQPYHHDSKVLIGGGIQSLTFSNSGDTSQKPNTLKQKNGFPPNFIHSLDSSHMMLTALHCYRKGLTFVSVHDCFWTHAADVAVMNQVCREQFVRLHSQPILHDLSRFLVARFCSGPRPKNVRVSRLLDVLLSVPKTGAFNLEQVKRSTYFFS
ncbi:DNA-directed RNA polymerase, mitochondrial [Pteropus alecto]|uniref:DNA-directed RNA polymerase n=1 Tax=Pteropus alecto TaxID=9402 RepID=L5L765_PTEAL|nr:DNA-directed RNA polymerase, mitochondrial [Pteropus alecto]